MMPLDLTVRLSLSSGWRAQAVFSPGQPVQNDEM